VEALARRLPSGLKATLLTKLVGHLPRL
jgi:hypothetical protein